MIYVGAILLGVGFVAVVYGIDLFRKWEDDFWVFVLLGAGALIFLSGVVIVGPILFP